MYQMYQQYQNSVVNVQNENEAFNYPVGYGATVYFKDVSAPYLYVKSMGFSQMEMPRFEKYLRVEEEKPKADGIEEMLTEIKADIESLKSVVFKKRGKESSDEQ